MSIIVTEQIEDGEKQECCLICGSLGVVHFEDTPLHSTICILFQCYMLPGAIPGQSHILEAVQP